MRTVQAVYGEQAGAIARHKELSTWHDIHVHTVSPDNSDGSGDLDERVTSFRGEIEQKLCPSK